MVSAVATDLGSMVWFGTRQGLVQLSDTTRSTLKRSNPDLPCDTVLSLYYDQTKGNLWIGTANGIAVYNKNGTKL